MAAPAKTVRTEHPHIVRTPGFCGGRPRIDGTRISVTTIVQFLRESTSAEGIVSALPNLSLAAVHDAISYYYDHQAEIDGELAEYSFEKLVANGFFTLDETGHYSHKYR